MKFTAFFVNHTTGEAVISHVISVSAKNAVASFRRRLRRNEQLSSGDTYQISLYTGHRPMEFPENCFKSSTPVVAR